MTRFYTNTWWRKALSAAVLAGVGLSIISVPPVQADPPNHAPAKGYRKKQEKQRDYRDQNNRRSRDDDRDDDRNDRRYRDDDRNDRRDDRRYRDDRNDNGERWKERNERDKREAELRRERAKKRAEYLRERDKRAAELRRDRTKTRAEWERERVRDARGSGRDGAPWENNRRRPNGDTKVVTWANRDADRDGAPNGRDRYPSDPKRQ